MTLLYEELTGSIRGSAMEVLNTLGPGLSEKCYENGLVIELIERGHFVEQQKSFSVYYKGRFVGKLTPDLIVDRKVIVDTKVVDSFCDEHVAQMLTYLSVTGLRLALLVNFKRCELATKRVIS